jgi:acyl-CoA thioester hydrolase
LITRLDGTLAAEITGTLGMLDLAARKLVADPRAALASAGVDVQRLAD